ncbi:mucin-2 [Engraulis encrasicolus]|uniref:mucin-2 n=1 Tax=Engraulis encrasicolus TaxID=184585 RepID=UPI002FD1FE09
MALYSQMIWVLFSVAVCVCHVLAESTLASLLDGSNAMATPAVTITNLRFSTTSEELAVGGVSSSPSRVEEEATTTMAVQTTTPSAAQSDVSSTDNTEKLDHADGTTADSSLEKTNILWSTLGLTTTNGETNTLNTNTDGLAAHTASTPAAQPQATTSSFLTVISTKEQTTTTTQITGLGPTTAEEHWLSQQTSGPSPPPQGPKATAGPWGVVASSQTTPPGPESSNTVAVTHQASVDGTNDTDWSVIHTESSAAGLAESSGDTESTMSPTGHSTQSEPDSTGTEREGETLTGSTPARHDATTPEADTTTTSSVQLNVTITDNDTHTTTTPTTSSLSTNLRTIFATLKTTAATAHTSPAPTAHTSTSTDMESGTSNLSLSVAITDSTSSPLNSSTLPPPHTVTTLSWVTTSTGDSTSPKDPQSRTTTISSDCPEVVSTLLSTKLTLFLTMWVLAMLASFFLGLSIFLWARLSAVRRSGSWMVQKEREKDRGRGVNGRAGGGGRGGRGGGAQERGTAEECDSLWASPSATVEERVEFWYANATMTNSSDRHRGRRDSDRRRNGSERKREVMNGGLWSQPRVTVADITEFWYGRDKARNHQTIPEEEETHYV